MIIKTNTYKYIPTGDWPTANRYVFIGYPFNDEYPVFSMIESFCGTLTKEEIKRDYKPAEKGQGWKGTF